MDEGQKIKGTNDGDLRIEYQNGRMIVSKNTIDLMLAGKDDQGNVVVKIALDGIDVKTASDDQLIFNSAQNVLKVIDIIPLTVPASSTTAHTTDHQDSVNINLTNYPADIIILPLFRDGINSPTNIWQGNKTYGPYSVGGASVGVGLIQEFYASLGTGSPDNIKFSYDVFNAGYGAITLGPYDLSIYILQQTAP
jgi:hypothetical protein